MFAGVALLALASSARAQLALAPLFTDGAVLQSDKPVTIWGTAPAGEKVLVAFGPQLRSATTGADGRWLVVLDAMPGSSTGAELSVSTRQKRIVLRDVVVGDVWFCSGQSNMEFNVKDALNAEQEIAAAKYPLIRHVWIDHQSADTPQAAVSTSGWNGASPEQVPHFTAIGYFFARDLHLRTGHPIGIVNCTWGGTPIQAWMSPLALASDPAFGVVKERWAAAVAAYPAAKAEHDEKLARWTTEEAAAKAAGEKTYAAWLRQNPRPYSPRGAPGDSWTPSGLFNGMVNPLLPYSVRGVLWYQGESNTDRPDEYHPLFAAMITTWRAHFGQGDIPFFWVNLAGFKANDPSDRAWAFLREAQTRTLALPNTGQAIAIDLGDPNEIHPRNKQEVARRLALLAKRRVYDITGNDSGPVFVSAQREGAALRVRFESVFGGLVARDKPPQALEIAGADRRFYPAVGRIERDTLVVTAPEVKEPVAVRYAYRNAPEANLYGGDGLPVVPFRSDAW